MTRQTSLGASAHTSSQIRSRVGAPRTARATAMPSIRRSGSRSAGSQHSQASRRVASPWAATMAADTSEVLPKPGPATTVTSRCVHRSSIRARRADRVIAPVGGAGGRRRNGRLTARNGTATRRIQPRRRASVLRRRPATSRRSRSLSLTSAPFPEVLFEPAVPPGSGRSVDTWAWRSAEGEQQRGLQPPPATCHQIEDVVQIQRDVARHWRARSRRPVTWTFVVETMGFEPTTPCLQSRCSAN